MILEQVTANISGIIRRETLQGRSYLVAPLSMIVPGVLNGSKGPLLYTAEDTAAGADSWNGMPIVVRHPMVNGKPVSARDPKILEQYQVGTVFNANMNGKLVAEGWFDEELTKRVDPRVYAALNAGKPMELSTGLFTKDVPAEPGAVHNGKTYVATAREHRPDHLAVLPDEAGACSLNDGCGLNINSDQKKTLIQKFMEILGLNSPMDSTGSGMGEDCDEDYDPNMGPTDNAPSASSYAYVPDSSKSSTWKLRIDDARHVAGAVAALGKGFRGNKVQIPSSALGGVKAKVRAAYKKFFPGKELPPVLNEENKDTEMPALTDNEKKTLVDSIITNCDCWKEEDRETLNKMDDRALKGIGSGVDSGKKLQAQEAVVNAAKKGIKVGDVQFTLNEKGEWDQKKESEKKETPVTNADKPKQMTSEEWFETAPPEVQSIVRNAINRDRAEKANIIQRLTANIKDEEVKKQQVARLEKRDLDDLRADVALLGNSRRGSNPFSEDYVPDTDYGYGAPNYSGASVPAFNRGGGRYEEVDKDDVLVPPTINYEELAKERNQKTA